MNDTRPQYIDAVDTAKLLRKALKKRFPETTFSVRTSRYSGGASIRVTWTDGPTKAHVEAVAKPFAGSGFDGMIDMKYSKDAWLLPDGTASWGRSEGTEGSAGVFSAYEHDKPHPEAKLVSFGADFIFCNREYSIDLLEKAHAIVQDEYGLADDEMPPVIDDPFIGPHIPRSDVRPIRGSRETVTQLIRHQLARTTG